MKISKVLFYLFAFVFFLFTLAFFDQQNYNMTGEEGGTRIWVMRAILVLDVISILIMFMSNNKYKGIHLICMLWLLIMPIVMLRNQSPIADLVQTILWPLIFEATFMCCYCQTHRRDFLIKVYYVITAFALYYFLMTRFGTNSQTNTIYFCYLTLPWFLWGDSNKRRVIVLLVFTTLALMSIKRSMVLASAIIWLFFIIEKMKSKRNIILSFALFAVLFVTINQVFNRIDANYGGQLSLHISKEETNEDGRLLIWNVTYNMIVESSFVDIIDGHGHFGVRKNSTLEISAHNDFLEVIYDYGLIIFILYLCLWGFVIKRTYYLYHIKSPYFLPYAASFGIFVSMSMVSHLILYTNYFNFLVMFWGMTEAILETQNLKIKRKAITL